MLDQFTTLFRAGTGNVLLSIAAAGLASVFVPLAAAFKPLRIFLLAALIVAVFWFFAQDVSLQELFFRQQTQIWR